MTLAEMKTLEAKTANPALHAKIGLEDPERPDSSSALVTALDAGGKSLGAVVLGRTGSTSDTMFARRASETQCWVVKPDLYLERNVKQWLQTDIWKLASNRVKSAVTTHPDGEVVAVERAAETEPDWAVKDVPEGSQPKSTGVGRILAAALEGLNFDNVAAVASKPLPEDERVTTSFDTFDGLHVVVTTARETGPAPAAPAEDEGAAPPEPTKTWWAKIEVSAGPDAAEAVKTEASEAAARLSPWIFALPEYRANSLRKHMADMIQPIPVAPPPADGTLPAPEAGGEGTEPPVPLLEPAPAPQPEPSEPKDDGQG